MLKFGCKNLPRFMLDRLCYLILMGYSFQSQRKSKPAQLPCPVSHFFKISFISFNFPQLWRGQKVT